MPSIFDLLVRAAILDRISRLTREREPVWGRFTAPEMVCHISCDLRQGLGELEAGPPSGPLARFPLNWLAIHVLPWPKGKGKSPPEFLGTRPTTWAADVGRLQRAHSALRGAWAGRSVAGEPGLWIHFRPELGGHGVQTS